MDFLLHMLMTFYGEDHISFFAGNVIKLLHKIFEIAPVNKRAFRYLGLDLKEGGYCYSNIVISQSNYVDSINTLKLDGKKKGFP